MQYFCRFDSWNTVKRIIVPVFRQANESMLILYGEKERITGESITPADITGITFAGSICHKYTPTCIYSIPAFNYFMYFYFYKKLITIETDFISMTSSLFTRRISLT